MNNGFTDREIMDDVLTSQKHITGVYNTFSNECVNQQLQNDMVNILKTIDNYCPADSTLTIEARQCLPCLQWLTEKGYI